MRNNPLYIPGEPIFNPKPEKNPSGAIIIDGFHVADTLQCKHCLSHWIPIIGSKKVRGWCKFCNGNLCGKPVCLNYCFALIESAEGKSKVTEIKKTLKKTAIK